jgi:hypothetical protein
MQRDRSDCGGFFSECKHSNRRSSLTDCLPNDKVANH